MDGTFMFRFCEKKCVIYQNVIVETKSSHIFIEKSENFLQITLEKTEVVMKNIRQV